jgi:hypothetical protein
MTPRKPNRSHKSKAEQKRLAKVSTVKVVGNGFAQRATKPLVVGDEKKSQLVRIDARFAAWLRAQAKKQHGSITNVTRRLNKHADVLAAMIEIKEGELEK